MVLNDFSSFFLINLAQYTHRTEGVWNDDSESTRSR